MPPTQPQATSKTPQIVTLIVDDSNSMQGLTQNGKSKAEIASKSIYDMVTTMQAFSQSSTRFRYLLNVAKFGDQVTAIANAQPPGDVNLEQLVFRGDSGWTVMAAALDWASAATEQSLAICRQLPVYDEAASPQPLVVFFTDGENTGPDIGNTVERLHSIEFKNGAVRVVACGIGLNPEHASVLRQIASTPEDAVNIKPSGLDKFIAAVGVTAIDPRRKLVFDADDTIISEPNWETQHSIGHAALIKRQWAAAEKAFTTAHSMVRSVGDQRLADTLISLATLHTQQGNWAKALPFAAEALALLTKLGSNAVLEPGLTAGVELAELLEISDQKDQARQLWTTLAGIWESSIASSLGESNGKLAAVGFRDLYEGRFATARSVLEKVKRNGGLAATAAAIGLDRYVVPAPEPHPEPLRENETTWDLQLSIGNKELNERHWAAAEQSFTNALSMVQSAGDYRLAETLTALTRLHTLQGDWGKALPFGKESLNLLATLGSTTALESGLKTGVELAELLEIANRKEEATHLWKKIASVWESSAAAGLAENNGKLAAAGFRDLREGQYSSAKGLLQRVKSAGGLGAMAALKGLAQIEEAKSGRAAAEPDMELLVAEVVKRFGPAHSLSRGVIATLRGSYVLGGKTDKIAKLNQKYPTQG